MPWREGSPMDQRTQFIADFLRDARSITELYGLYGVSRKTGYKWIDRYLRQGPPGLAEQSRRPRRSPNQTSDEDRRRDPRGPTPAPELGRQEVAGAAEQAASAVDAARPVHGVRHPQATWDGADH